MADVDDLGSSPGGILDEDAHVSGSRGSVLNVGVSFQCVVPPCRQPRHAHLAWRGRPTCRRILCNEMAVSGNDRKNNDDSEEQSQERFDHRKRAFG